ncbi:VanZ family protein [Mammaliicoccus sciuri]|uniref:VanZ like family protein n=2 Tax=Sporosarcina newyorkensis TaxID=759851 RepID=A0A1T4Y0D9_9BACL|nr:MULTISPECIES: VanZ family protein [Sporosarcina]EGQ26921.1 VanZ like family protein [Sporosarcina newyorkensis 2681]MBY0221482.1 VanZ family protein [Sporosarcina aquimarina]SKA95297.1 VanZ like family protein [Sporosarcina newyorkensis]
MKKFIVILILIALLVGLAISSSQTYEQQSLVSTLEQLLPDEPGKAVLSELEFSYWDRIISVDERGYYYFVEFLIRKAAHFLTFGFLSLVIYWVLPKRKGRLLGAALLTLILACADELHQSFTGGRTATLQDVYLDMAGAITFLFIVAVVQFIRAIRKI